MTMRKVESSMCIPGSLRKHKRHQANKERREHNSRREREPRGDASTDRNHGARHKERVCESF